jgi:DegV family protein with EDD domain
MPAKFNLMTDSCCDFSIQDIERANITYLPFSYAEAGKPDGGLSGTDDLFQSRSAHDFYEQVRWGATPMTSQPSQLVYEEAFRKAAELDVPTVLVTLSSGISGAYNGAVTALDRLRAELGRELPIYIVDSLIGSTAQYLLIEEAVRQRDKGISAEDFVRWAEDARYHVRTIFMVDSLDTLHHGGRIPKSVALVSGAIDAKPLLTFKLDGSLTILGVTRGRKKAMRKMADYYEKNCSELEYPAVAAIGNADCEHDGMRLGTMLCDLNDGIRILPSTIGPTIGSHVGPGMLSCCFWGSDRRDKKNALVGKVRGVRQG